MKTIAERKSFMTNNKIKKTAKINLRVTPEEYISIKEKSKKASLSVSELIRRLLDDETIVEAPPVDFYAMIREIKRVGSNLDQVLHKLNAAGIAHPLELKRCANRIWEVIDLLYKTYSPGKRNN